MQTLTLMVPGRSPLKVPFEPAPGRALLDVITSAGLAQWVDSECGGTGSCGGCRVRILGPVDPPSDIEKFVLEPAEVEQGIRLACQLFPQASLTIAPLTSATSRFKEGLVSAERASQAVDPVVRKTCCALPKPSLTDQRTDWQRLVDALNGTATAGADLQPDLVALRALPAALRAREGQVTAVLYQDTVLDVEPGDTSRQMLAAAVDIGTTTVAVYLLDLATGQRAGVAAGANPQGGYGADVISRMAAVVTDGAALGDMQRLIANGINGWLTEAAARAGVDVANIYELVVGGNTCMLQLFAGVDPRHLAGSPFVASFGESMTFRAAELGIALHPAARVYLLPCIGGYVGGDIVADVLATGLTRRPGTRLLIDIGTNGEIVLARDGELVTCATAAGPAFEGAHIDCGMRAAPGAIDHVSQDGKFAFTVIGREPPRGLCGSGLFDAMAALVRAGIVDASGRFQPAERWPEGLQRRWGTREGIPYLTLAPGGARPVYLSQGDVRQVQMAKGAIRAGVEILLKEMVIGYEQIDEVLLAGAFGSFIDPASALAIGLLPPVPVERVRAVGNTAGEGAALAALSASARAEAGEICRRAKYIELSVRSDFSRTFLKAMSFPA